MHISVRGQISTQALESSPHDQLLGRGCALDHPMGPPSVLTALGRGQNWVPDPAFSVATKGRSVPCREDIVESVITTIVSVANGCPLMLPPLEIVDGIK